MRMMGECDTHRINASAEGQNGGSILRQCRSSYTMKLQDLIPTARSLFDYCRPTLGFVVLSFLGVTLFLSPTSCGSCVVP